MFSQRGVERIVPAGTDFLQFRFKIVTYLVAICFTDFSDKQVNYRRNFV